MITSGVVTLEDENKGEFRYKDQVVARRSTGSGFWCVVLKLSVQSGFPKRILAVRAGVILYRCARPGGGFEQDRSRSNFATWIPTQLVPWIPIFFASIHLKRAGGLRSANDVIISALSRMTDCIADIRS